MSVSKRSLFSIWCKEDNASKKCSAVESYVYTIIDRSKYNDDQRIEISKKVKNFTSKIGMKWRENHRSRSTFEKNNKVWLNGEIVFEDPNTSTARPKVSDNAAKEIRCEELMSAVSTSMVVSKFASISDDNEPIMYTPEEALALYIDGDYTKKVYMDLQSEAKKRNANIYPTYDVLQSAKKLCHPNGLEVTDHSFEVPLQCLIDHTVCRIIAAHSLDFKNIEISKFIKITASYKWGCDGSSGYATHGHNIENIGFASTIDQHMFTVCLVPLQIVSGSTILWKNTKPSSIRYCRPIKLLCEKETADLIQHEVNNVQIQISKVLPTKIQNYEVHHRFHMSMIDGKDGFSIVADESSQNCGICGVSRKNMNNLQLLKNLKCQKSLYEYGLSPSYAWTRFFECILHIAYRIPIQKWQICDTDKAIVDKNITEIQRNLEMEMAILIDIPLPESGTTNNVNTARKFFQQPNLAAKITGVNSALIYRFSVILRTIASGLEINTDAFQQYAYQTATIFVDLYPWFYMPSFMHKILIHGADIIKHVSLPIGMMIEEALEARNKELRKIRLNQTRENSRKNTMKNLAHTLFVSSDPFITMLSEGSVPAASKDDILDSEVIGLLSNTNKELNISDDSLSDTE